MHLYINFLIEVYFLKHRYFEKYYCLIEGKYLIPFKFSGSRRRKIHNQDRPVKMRTMELMVLINVREKVIF